MLEKEKLKKKQDLLKPAAIDSACINASSSSQEAFHTSKRGEIIVTQVNIVHTRIHLNVHQCLV